MPDFPTLADLEPAPASTGPVPPPPTPAQPILEWLEGEGFRARLDEDGDVHLRHEGRDVFVVFDAEQRFFALTVANRLNASLKVAKISLRSDGATGVAVELFVSGPEALRAVLPRCLDLIGAATWEFRERMKEAMRKAADDDAAMREFVEEERNVATDAGRKTVTLSKIFDWFEKDFLSFERVSGNPDPKIVDYVNRYRASKPKLDRSFRVRYFDYDKRINGR